MTKNTKVALGAAGFVVAVLAGLALMLTLPWEQADARLVLRVDGCTGLMASGIDVEPLQGGLCAVSGKYYRGGSRSGLHVGGIRVEMSNTEIVAAKPL